MTHLFRNTEVCVNMLLIPSLCALTKCLRTNRVLDDCPRDEVVLYINGLCKLLILYGVRGVRLSIKGF